MIHCEECYHAAGLDFFCHFLGRGLKGRGGRGTPSSQNGKQVSELSVAILIFDELFWIFSPFSWWGPMMGEVPTIRYTHRSFDCISWPFLQAILSLHRLKFVYILVFVTSSLTNGWFWRIAASIAICSSKGNVSLHRSKMTEFEVTQ